MPPVFGPVSPSPTHFVVLGGGQRQRVDAVAYAKETGLFADQKLLDDHFRARFAERALETVVDGRERLFQRIGDRHALAGGKSVGLDDDGRAHFARIGLGLWRVVEPHIGAGRNVVPVAEVLCEAL